MQLEHFILARESSIDQQRNSLSVFDFIEDLTIHTQPANVAVPLPIQAVAVFRRDDEVGRLEFHARLRAFDPNGESLFDQSFPVVMQPEHRRFRMRLNFPLQVTTSGDYRIAVQSDEDPAVHRETRITLRREDE